MNQAKKKYEDLLVLHYKLCRASQSVLKDIGKQIADTLQYVEKYNLFPIELPEDFREQLAQMCEVGSDELKLKISKDLYVFLGHLAEDRSRIAGHRSCVRQLHVYVQRML